MNIREHFSLEDLIRRGMPHHEAIDLLRDLDLAPGFADEPSQWSYLSRQVLRPHHPASVHEDLFQETYRTWDPRKGPPPAWVPPDDIRSRCNLGRLLDRLGFATESEFRAWSVRDRAGFWAAMVHALAIQFDRPYEAVVDLTDGPERPRWFPGAMLNITASCFRADPEAIALRQHTERGEVRELTYGALERLCNRVANSLASAGVAPGDPVGLLLPMTVEAIAVLLGIIRAGCVAVAVAESFAPPEIELRLRIGGARLVITQDDDPPARGPPATLPQAGPGHRGPGRRHPVGRRTGDPAPPRGPALERLPLPARRVHAGPPRAGGARGPPLLLRDHGRPQGDPLVASTPIKAAADGFLYQDIQPGDVVAWPTSLGWMMGPWLVFATLLNRGTIALYDGHPGTEDFCRFVAEAGVTILGLVPSLVTAWKAHDWPANHDWSRIKLFSSTGECSSPGDMLYLMSRAGYRPVIEYCGGTEIGGAYLTSSLLLPNAPGCFNTVAYGLELAIRDDRGRPADRGEGFLIGPSVGLSTELLNRDHHAVYYAGVPEEAPALRRHGDQIERLPGGFYRVLGRVDDTMNLGGIKVSAVEIERVLDRHPLVRESAAVAVQDAGGGPEYLVAYLVPAQPAPDARTLQRELQSLLREQLNPLFKLGEVVLVDALPRTASNKLMRRLLRSTPR